MKSTVYIETSVISYFTAKPSLDLIVAAHQQITNDWWENALPNIEEINARQGIRTPIICTPEELMEG